MSAPDTQNGHLGPHTGGPPMQQHTHPPEIAPTVSNTMLHNGATTSGFRQEDGSLHHSNQEYNTSAQMGDTDNETNLIEEKENENENENELGTFNESNTPPGFFTDLHTHIDANVQDNCIEEQEDGNYPITQQKTVARNKKSRKSRKTRKATAPSPTDSSSATSTTSSSTNDLQHRRPNKSIAHGPGKKRIARRDKPVIHATGRKIKRYLPRGLKASNAVIAMENALRNAATELTQWQRRQVNHKRIPEYTANKLDLAVRILGYEAGFYSDSRAPVTQTRNKVCIESYIDRLVKNGKLTRAHKTAKTGEVPSFQNPSPEELRSTIKAKFPIATKKAHEKIKSLRKHDDQPTVITDADKNVLSSFVLPDEVRRVFMRGHHASSPGQDQITYNHIKAILKRFPKAADYISKIYDVILRTGAIPKTWLQAKLIFIPKKDGTFRPIALQSIFIRTLHRLILKQIPFDELLPSNHFGCATRGTQLMVKTIREYLVTRPGCVVASLDIANAFNSIDRSLVRDIVKHHISNKALARYIVNFLDNAYLVAQDGSEIRGRQGIFQGDALSAGLFSLTYATILQEWEAKHCPRDSNGNCNVQIIAYADDTCIIAKDEETLRQAWPSLINSLSDAGLQVHPKKTSVLASGRGDGDQITITPATEEQEALQLNYNSKAKIAGIWLNSQGIIGGVTDIKTEWSEHLSKLSKNCSLQSFIVLAKHCAQHILDHRLGLITPEDTINDNWEAKYLSRDGLDMDRELIRQMLNLLPNEILLQLKESDPDTANRTIQIPQNS